MKLRITGACVALVAVIAAACGGGGGGGQPNNAQGLEKAAGEFSKALFGGQTSTAYSFLSEQCRDEISEREFRDTMRAAEALFEVFAGAKFEDLEVGEVKTRNVEDGTGEALVVFKELEGAEGAALNDTGEYDTWMYEDGGWRLTDCEEFATQDAGDGDGASTPVPDGDGDSGRTGPGSSRTDPAPIGAAVEVAGWSIVVNSVIPDGTEAVRAESDFNDPPADGNQFFLINLTATYVGNGEDDSTTLFFSLDFGAVGASNVAYDPFEDNCGFATLPDPLDQNAEVFEGGSVTGNICWEVDEDDADALLLFADESFTSGDRAWFGLR
jgi:hypothetical protein